ncbi:N-acetylmuramoyl-L-alanine amidase family protein [Butyrivibrio sp. AE3009]|uniref:N-acetylmuramoyl-L-alanine amidase family protein n=1 Tax=Butyrivibrio sp. AE3009 TaxID=1280666 RepID=UPI0003B37A76|nr:N-acetylmuramoyl-L-alanine amidase [Butyrivibrio sp. AE3009]
MDNALMKKMVIRASVFTVLSLAVCLHRSATKHIMITDAAGNRVDSVDTARSYDLLVDKNVEPGKEGVLTIPLSKNVGSDDIVLEDRYIDHELRIYIKGCKGDFYMDKPVVSALDSIEGATCICEDDSNDVCLDFKLDGLYGNESLLTDQGTIEVTFFNPKERYDRVVVVDPVGGGSEAGYTASDVKEKDIALLVAKELKTISDKDVGVRTKMYFTRMDDSDIEDSRRTDFLEETDADIYIRIGACTSENPGICGLCTEYNDTFFLRGLNNGELADILEKNCVAQMNCNAAGCHVTSDNILAGVRIPSAKVNLGYVTNSGDAVNMQQSAYAKKAAEGIYIGILEAFKEME